VNTWDAVLLVSRITSSFLVQNVVLLAVLMAKPMLHRRPARYYTMLKYAGNFDTDLKQWVISLWGGKHYDAALLVLESV
jgi:hypothetical protein